jgi:chromosome segregation ATPase
LGEENITRGEIEERFHRVEDENNRQNRRLEKLENIMDTINELTASVQLLAVRMEAMQKEMEKQGVRLETIEKEPAENWRSVVKIVISVVVTAVVSFLIAKGGL